jgi:phospholipid/cholesterol/gamma-HCH transport system ATP-binding protein
MIVIKDLWKSYGRLKVLKGLNLQIKSGETLVILGRSGVGKSVLLKQIIGIEKPEGGSITVNGTDLLTADEKKKYGVLGSMGMLFQGAALFDSMNVEENVGFYLTEHLDPETGKHRDAKEVHRRVGEALSMVGLEGIEHKMPSELSGGMRKRAALARLIAYRPQILLFDEPTTGLDPITAMQIDHLIVETQRELKATSIVVTHDIRSALEVGDHLALFEDGQIVTLGTPDNFFNHPLAKKFLENAMIQVGASKA